MVRISTELVSSKRYTLVCAPIEDSDQHAHPHSLTRIFNGTVRSLSSQGSIVSLRGKLNFGQTVLMRRFILIFAAITYNKVGLLDQAVILFNCVHFQNGNFS